MTSEDKRQCLEDSESRHWTPSGYGRWNVGKVDLETGETLLGLWIIS